MLKCDALILQEEDFSISEMLYKTPRPYIKKGFVVSTTTIDTNPSVVTLVS